LEVIKENNNTNIEHQRYLDKDDDLDLSWQGLKQPNQTIEWFNENHKLLGFSGKTNNFQIDDLTLGFKTLPNSPPIRVLVIAVYKPENPRVKHLKGYIRATESTESITMLLSQLLWGFAIGSFVTIGLIGVGGLWLTQQSLKPLAKSYDQLKQFTGDASHELRSPLTAIKTSVEVLQTHPERIHPQDLEKIHNIVSATNQMKCLVDDLLFLARTDNDLDLFPQQITVIPLEDLLEDIVTFLDINAEEKAVNLQFYSQGKFLVRGNVFQLQRLFSNLIDNAIKYTDVGGDITVSLKNWEERVVVTIQDSGIGIKKEDLPFIFDRFWRAERARSPERSGTGLGLAIAQSIIQQHQGQIIVESKLAQGTCFTVLLPMAS
ncbi:MAG: hypothetical protein RLZZ490_2109, partial [Cyanobacteriota bacterium]